MVQTVVAHRQHSLIGTARSLSFAKKSAAGCLVSTEQCFVFWDGKKTLGDLLFRDWRRLLFTQRARDICARHSHIKTLSYFKDYTNEVSPAPRPCGRQA